jgi:hypothetical protein
MSGIRMSGISNATTPCGIIYHVYLYKNLYGKTVNAYRRAKQNHALGNLFCLSFRNPLTGVVTLLGGKRIIDIVENYPNNMWCSAEERIAGLVILYSSFFRSILAGFNRATKHHNNLTLYCLNVTVPSNLFPNYSGNSTFTVRGKELMAIMFSAIGQSGLPSGFN